MKERKMLKYNGKFYFDKELSTKELEFLSEWQQKLTEIQSEYLNVTISEKEDVSKKINTYSSIDFDAKQRWAIFFGMSPMIYFHKDCIELKGQSKKGNMREALLAYHHFFLSENSVLTQCMNLDFMKPHQFSGIVEAEKWSKGIKSNWCYLSENSNISSISSPTINDYKKSPKKWIKIDKEDTFYDKLVLYFPPLIEYAKIKKSITSINEKKDIEKKHIKKIKI
jgi:hypothetical protein